MSDRGYQGDVDKDIEKDFGIELEASNTPNGVKGFLPKPLRWVVERTFAWLDSCRRLARNYEILNESAEEMIDFAAIKFLINKILTISKTIFYKFSLRKGLIIRQK